MIAAWQRATHRLLAALDAELGDLGLSAGETNALAALAEGPRTARALAEATAQPPSTLTGVLDRLERRGLIERRANPADRRSTLVAPTARGRPVVARVAAAFAALEREVCAEVAADDVHRLLSAVEAAALRGPRRRRSAAPPRRSAGGPPPPPSR